MKVKSISVIICQVAIFISCACPLEGAPSTTVSSTSTATGVNNPSSKKIYQLPYDCQYEIFINLCPEDLSNLIQTSPFMPGRVQYSFNKSVLESIKQWRINLLEIMSEKKKKMQKENLSLLRAIKPRKFPIVTDHQVVLLFKIAPLMVWYETSVVWYILMLQSHMEKTINEKNHYEHYTSVLTLYDHHAILTYFQKNWHGHNELVWMYHAYLMILEKTNHLNNQFTFQMMVQVNKVRNVANAHKFLRDESGKSGDASKLQYTERYQINWNLYKYGKPSDDIEENFNLIIAQIEVLNLNSYNMLRSRELETKYYAQVYTSIHSLSGSNFTKLVDASNLNLVHFDLATNSDVKKIRQSLVEACKGSKTVEKGLPEQLKALDEFTGKKGDVNIDGFKTLRNYATISGTYQEKFITLLKKKTEEIEKAIDVSKYLKLLRISVQVTRYINHFEMKQLFWRVYFVYYHFVSEPKVFDDMQKLSEVDRLSTQLYESSPYSFHLHKNNYAQRNATKILLQTTFANFQPQLVLHSNDKPETRTKQRIVLKCLIGLTNAVYPPTQDYPVDSEGYNQLTTVMKLFYAFAAIDSEELSRDSCLLREWLYFNGVLLNNGVIDYYTQENVEEFKFLYRPYRLSKNLIKDAFAYLCHTNTAKAMHKVGKPIPSQLLKNIIALEESIGNAVLANQLLRHNLLIEKLIFHQNFGDQIAETVDKKNLNKYFDSQMDLILIFTSSIKTELGIENERINNPPSVITAMMRPLYATVIKHQKEIAKLLDEKIIEKLGDVSRGLELDNPLFKAHLKTNYEACKEVLNI